MERYMRANLFLMC